MKKKFLVFLLAILLVGAGIVTATEETKPKLPSIVILPDSGPNVASDGTILVPVGEDANVAVGLAVQYSDFKKRDEFSINITNSSGSIVYQNSGKLSKKSEDIAIHWIVPNDLSEKYTIIAEGKDKKGKRVTAVKESKPIQPIPVSPFVLVGFVLTSGVLYIRRGKKLI